jgi:hypothetical protein
VNSEESGNVKLVPLTAYGLAIRMVKVVLSLHQEKRKINYLNRKRLGKV